MRVLIALWQIFTNPAFYKLTLTAATPLIFASLGGVFSETTGVVNIALEGIMLMAAFWSVVFTAWTGNPWLGVLFAVLVGVGMAWLHAWASIKWRGNQIVSGTALILLAQGVTGFLMEPIFGRPGQTDIVGRIPEVRIPFLMKNRFLAQSIGELSPMIYMAFASVFIAWFIIYKTKLGLRMRAVGENPEAADTLGVNVYAVRYFGVLMSGVMAALGGAFLSIGEVGNFREFMTGGRGFIALAAMIVGNWNPIGAMWASLMFGFSEALANQLQSSPILKVASTTKPLFNMFPFIVTLVVIAGFIGKTRPPAADGIPYEK
ncbi:ABC transporter permease [Pseudothermotoga thermarum]|uniref:ABC transporter permease n=1 Tax=Pseudothermotoga thermarum TaxID=119394 RepID=UPI00059CD32A|nr:ABC transporter permease [Pseudothermotoga thermarum]